ncbi:hypothetical protein H1R20_g296, partial [Candolleomyces eurysporus]
MANGPPPSAAESSGTSSSGSSQYQPVLSQPTNAGPTTSIPPYNYGSWWSGYPTSMATAACPGGYATTQASQYNPNTNFQMYYPAQTIPQTATLAIPQPAAQKSQVEARRKSPTPPPPLEVYKHWDEAMKTFLEEAGLLETLKAFESDMLILSSDWEEERLPLALQRFVKRLSVVSEYSNPKDEEAPQQMAVDEDPAPPPIPLDERKLTYMKLADGSLPRTPTSTNKSIAQFLAQNRAKNNVSNRSEFLYSLSERRRHIQENNETDAATIDPSQIGSCARTDAKPINRDEQMKYDIAKNNDGPLSRTMKAASNAQSAGGEDTPTTVAPENITMSTEELVQRSQDEESVTSARYPALDDRLKNIEVHLAVRYVPSPPRTLISRLKFLEEHIIKLEKEYPPWAALHFNQPNRGWPPPPRATPIIVPPNLRSKEELKSPSLKGQTPSGGSTKLEESTMSTSSTGNSKSTTPTPAMSKRNAKSSLHRAVMEKLQVQQALNDLGQGS